MRCVLSAICVVLLPLTCAQASAERSARGEEQSPVLTHQTSTHRKTADRLSGGTPEQMLYFGGFDIWQSGIGVHAGMQWATRGNDNDGPIVRALVSAGYETFETPTNTYRTLSSRVAIMPGYKFKRGKFELQLLAGFDGEVARVRADRRSIGFQSIYGGRVTADMWWEPLPLFMVQASIAASTINKGVVTRLATGWWTLDSFWAGPELIWLNDDYSTQYRVGAHLTSYRFGGFEWSASAGYAADSLQRGGVYGRLGLLRRQ